MFKQSKQRSYVIIATVLVLSIISFFSVKNLKFNYDFEAFFPNEDKELVVYENFRKTFEHDNEFVLLGIENKKGIFVKDFLLKIDSLTKQLKEIENVTRVISPTNLKQVNFAGLAPVEVNLLHINDTSLYRTDSINAYTSQELVGSFFPKDAGSVCIFVKTADNLSKVKSDSLAKRIERAFSKYHFDEVHYVGRIVAQDVYLKKLQHEFTLFLVISFVLVVGFLFFTFRTMYGVLLPIIIVLVSIFLTLGLMGLIGKSINIMTVMLPTMIFIAGMSDVVHFFSKYFEEMEAKCPQHLILRKVIKEVGLPTFFTLITTAVGFLSLLFENIKPVKEFGIFTSIGILIAFILTYTLLPAIMHLLPPKKIAQKHNESNRVNNFMRFIFFWNLRNQKKIFVITLFITSIAVWGISKIRVNNLLLEDLSQKERVKQDFNYFDKHYSGVRPFEMLIELKDSSKKVWDYEVIQEINKMDRFLSARYHIGFMLSPASLAKNINKALNGNDPNFYNLPATKEEYGEIKKYLFNNKKNKDLKRIIATDGRSCRISGKIEDIGSLKIDLLNKEFSVYINSNIDKKLLSYTITGAATLMDRNNEYMVKNMLMGFSTSILVISLLTFLIHKSWRMVIVFLIPNFIPMLLIAGIMGVAGIELKAATSLIFSIAFGIATDDTIHFISRLKLELDYGKSLLFAFRRTYFETGKPIILTNFILMAGFMSLMISDFTSTFYFGLLICITLVLALIADLFLLPLLIMMLYGNKKKSDA